MRQPHAWLTWCTAALLTTAAAPAAAQSLYVGAGLGPTVLLDDQPPGFKTTDRGFYGMVGLDLAGPIGLRLEGTETYGFLWSSLEVTYRFGAPQWPMQPYALAGAGLRVDVSAADPIGSAGAGVRADLGGPLFLFGEGRVHYVLSDYSVFAVPSIPGTFPARSFLLLTLGVAIAP